VRPDGVRTEHDYWLRDFLEERGRVEYQDTRKDAPRCSQTCARFQLRLRRYPPVGLGQSKRDSDEAGRLDTRSETVKLMSVHCRFAFAIARNSDQNLHFAILPSEVGRRGDE